mgnify:CR=1 FL=1
MTIECSQSCILWYRYLELLYIWKVFRNSKGDDGKGELHTYVIGKGNLPI